MKHLLLIIAIALTTSFIGCSDDDAPKHGGNTTIDTYPPFNYDTAMLQGRWYGETIHDSTICTMCDEYARRGLKCNFGAGLKYELSLLHNACGIFMHPPGSVYPFGYSFEYVATGNNIIRPLLYSGNDTIEILSLDTNLLDVYFKSTIYVTGWRIFRIQFTEYYTP